MHIADYINQEWLRSSAPFPDGLPVAALTQNIDFSNIDERTSDANRTNVLARLGLLDLVKK